jgi:hypothetical protein
MLIANQYGPRQTRVEGRSDAVTPVLVVRGTWTRRNRPRSAPRRPVRCPHDGHMSYGPKPVGDFARLAAHLAMQPGPRLTLTFAEVEAITGGLLPLRARLQEQWWRAGWHGRAPHTLAWRATGWEVEHVDAYDGTVTFVRVESTAPDAHGGP